MANRPGMKVGDVEHNVQNDMLTVGSKAPDFTLRTTSHKPKTLADYAGKVKIISCIPSVDTGVCAAQTRRFNVEASKLSKDIVIVVISMDLPAAQKRWCGAAGVDQVMTVSDVVKADFGKKYGTLMKEVRLLRRAVFVVDKQGIVTYAAYMPTNKDEPNYAEVLAAAKKALEM